MSNLENAHNDFETVQLTFFREDGDDITKDEFLYFVQDLSYALNTKKKDPAATFTKTFQAASLSEMAENYVGPDCAGVDAEKITSDLWQNSKFISSEILLNGYRDVIHVSHDKTMNKSAIVVDATLVSSSFNKLLLTAMNGIAEKNTQFYLQGDETFLTKMIESDLADVNHESFIR